MCVCLPLSYTRVNFEGRAVSGREHTYVEAQGSQRNGDSGKWQVVH